ncbi:MAG: class I poly(R)-hydroxyalkanoic acid synthase [Roseiarcus sp.]|jgi:polyhydroxyalkanoate synthase
MAIDPLDRPQGRPPARQPSAAARASKTPPGSAQTSNPLATQPPIEEPAPGKQARTKRKTAAKIATPEPSAAALAPVPPAQLPAATPVAAPPVQPPAAAPAAASLPLPNIDALSHNVARLIEEGGKVAAAFLAPRETGETKPTSFSEDMSDAVATLGKVAEHYYSDPQRAFQAQAALSTQFMALWAATLQRLNGEQVQPIAAPEPNDKRFADPEWRTNPYFDFLAQAYVMTTRWAGDLVKKADELDPHTRDKAQFYVRQLAGALSPSNFIATNPELMRATLAESGENLVRGLRMMAQDIEAGHGNLRIRQSDASKFVLGQNMAATPGKVIFRNELMELIQYAPSTATVYKRPVLIVPPWINKYYVLDLNPEKSFVRWAVAQGLTVFVISWVNPDERHAQKGFEAYMREGIFAALESIEQATGEREAAAIGYCVGGTLLAIALAYMAQTGDERIASATLFATQVDFTDAGDLKVFVDCERLKAVEEKMADKGYLDGLDMAGAFNMLRPNDLIWSYFVNNYLKGQEPAPFDLLVWNSDSTRMPAANHSFYLRNCYLENNLTRGRMVLAGKTLDLSKVMVPIYELATREDHIAPARSVFLGAQFFGGPVRYVMAGSGHIAGVINPPDKPKYQYWTGGPPGGAFDGWVAAATENPGSWWPDWAAWVAQQAPERVPARQPGEGKLKALADAPGDYVKAKA